MKMVKLSEDHYVVVDESELKENVFVYNFYHNRIERFSAGAGSGLRWQITHSTQPLEDVGLNTSMGCQLGFDKIEPLYLSEVKELFSEDTDVWSRKLEYLKKVDENIKHKSQDERIWIFGASDLGFTAGYNQALEDNKEKKYTEEDMQWALYEARHRQEHSIEEIIQALQPKTEWKVEFVDGKLKLI